MLIEQEKRPARVRFRHPIRVVTLDGQPRVIRTLTANVSRKGLFLRMPQPLPNGTKVALSLEAGGRALALAQAEVMWGRLSESQLPGRYPGCGVKFTEFLHPRAQALVDYLVDNLDRGKPLTLPKRPPLWVRARVPAAAAMVALFVGILAIPLLSQWMAPDSPRPAAQGEGPAEGLAPPAVLEAADSPRPATRGEGQGEGLVPPAVGEAGPAQVETKSAPSPGDEPVLDSARTAPGDTVAPVAEKVAVVPGAEPVAAAPAAEAVAAVPVAEAVAAVPVAEAVAAAPVAAPVAAVPVAEVPVAAVVVAAPVVAPVPETVAAAPAAEPLAAAPPVLPARAEKPAAAAVLASTKATAKARRAEPKKPDTRRGEVALPTGAAPRLTWTVAGSELRLAPELAGQAHLTRAFVLEGPPRVVFDVAGAAPKKSLTVPASPPYATAVRLGKQGNGTRIVIDLDTAPKKSRQDDGALVLSF